MEFFATVFLAQVDNSAISETLGVVAGVAFLGTAIWVVVTLARDTAAKQTVNDAVESQLDRELRNRASQQDAMAKELESMKEEFAVYYAELLDGAKLKLGELTTNANSALYNISRAYARYAINKESESQEAISNRFTRVCELQWSFFKNELGYVSVKDLEPHLRMILTAHEVINQMGCLGADDEETDMNLEVSPAMQRIQEVGNLFNAMPRERMGNFQMDSMEAIDPFKYYFNSFVRDWVGNCDMEIVRKVRTKGKLGSSIKDTEYKAKFIRFKNIIDTVGQLCERLDSNTQQVGEEEVAFNQIVFGSAVLSIVASLQEWFPELGVAQKTTPISVADVTEI